jgi:ribonuclease BN (tRNA processing enzyme)
MYSGDSTLCDPLLRLVSNADVVVLECSCGGHEPVHLSAEDVAEIVRQTKPDSRSILTHLDGNDHPLLATLARERGLLVASDLARFSL